MQPTNAGVQPTTPTLQERAHTDAVQQNPEPRTKRRDPGSVIVENMLPRVRLEITMQMPPTQTQRRYPVQSGNMLNTSNSAYNEENDSDDDNNKRERKNHRLLEERKLRRNRSMYWTTTMMMKTHRHLNEREFRRNSSTSNLTINLTMMMIKNYKRLLLMMTMMMRPNRMERRRKIWTKRCFPLLSAQHRLLL